MKKLFILSVLVLSLVSCNSQYEEFDEPTSVVTRVSVEDGCVIGLEILNSICWTNELLPEEIELVDYYCDRVAEDNHDVQAIIDAICYLQQFPQFGDTVEECEIWNRWCKWYSDYILN